VFRVQAWSGHRYYHCDSVSDCSVEVIQCLVEFIWRIEDSRCRDMVKVFGQFEVKVNPVGCLEVKSGCGVKLTAFHVDGGYNWQVV